MSHINNPFASPASVVGNAESKYPDLSGEISGRYDAAPSPVHQSQPPYYQQQQYQQQPAPMQYQQQTGMYQSPQPSMMQYQPTGMSQPHTGMMHHSQWQQSQQPGPSYSQQRQQQWPQSNPASEFDPYGNLDSLASASSPGPNGGGSRTLQGTLQKDVHPRAYVNQQKAQLMAWDQYAWKQLLNKLDALREAWESRKALLVEVARQGADPTTAERMRRQAEEHIDSIHASKMQLSEVESGWRHSTDAASKARVREAINAGLTSLPEYPQPLESHALGGSFMTRARNDFILSQYNSPTPQQQQQQQQQQAMQMQQTGMMYYPQQQQQQQPYNPYGMY